jgi:hypothetical protein
MAIANTVVYNLQSDGSGYNGGGFVDDTGTYPSQVDYSQQATAQLSITDGASVDGSAVLTSVTGGFTAAMEGNIVCISAGTNHILGFYEIVTYTDTNTVTLDRDCATGGNMSAATCKVGGAWNFDQSSMYSTFLSSSTLVVGPNGSNPKIYIKAGSYTLLADFSITFFSSSASQSRFAGYQTAYDDNPTGTNRPLIDCDTFFFADSGGYSQYENLRFTGTDTTYVVREAGDYAKWINCYFESTATSAYAFSNSGGNDTRFHGCEFTGGTSACLYSASSGSTPRLYGCYIHDGVTGLSSGSGGFTAVGSIFDTLSLQGIVIAGTSQAVNNCVFYNCGTGISAGNAFLLTTINNIFHTCTTGITFNQPYAGYFSVSHNCWYNNGTDIGGAGTAFYIGAYDIEADPLFTDPANGDFSLGGSSPCLGTGIGAHLTGATI